MSSHHDVIGEASSDRYMQRKMRAIRRLKGFFHDGGMRLIWHLLILSWLFLHLALALISGFSDVPLWTFDSIRIRDAYLVLLLWLGLFALSLALTLSTRCFRSRGVAWLLNRVTRPVLILLASLYLIVRTVFVSEVPVLLGMSLLSLALPAAIRRPNPGGERAVLRRVAYAVSIFTVFFIFLRGAIGLFTFDYASLSPPQRSMMRTMLTAVGVAACLSAVIVLIRTLSSERSRLKRLADRSRHHLARGFVTAAALLHIALFSAIMIYRVTALVTPTYDFGLFSQMFHYMSSYGTPMTTLERSRLLSHFEIHFSPIFYLFLPIYRLIPRPETLQVLQIVTVASAVIPCFLLARRAGLNDAATTLVCTIFLCHPGLSCSSMYDLHENCFLAPLVLWMLYTALSDHRVSFGAVTLLLLLVKEDAVLYVVCIGLWLMFRKKTRWLGLGAVTAGLLAFAGITAFLTNRGQGVMLYRYANIQAFPEKGLFGYLLTLIAMPGYLLDQIFTTEKILYLLQMVLPLGLLPLLGRRLDRIFLVLPFLVMNLIPNYQYQHNMTFQYQFATTALLVFLMIQTYAERQADAAKGGDRHRLRVGRRQVVAAVLALSCGLAITTVLWHRQVSMIRHVAPSPSNRAVIHRALDKIPRDASVRATTFLTTPLSDREILFDIGYEYLEGADLQRTDYIVIDGRWAGLDKHADYISRALQTGYKTVFEEKDLLLILKNTDP